MHQIRLNKFPDPTSFFGQIASIQQLEAADKKELADEATRLFNRFKDYSIASVTLHDMDIEDVAPIFERINSTGTKLTIFDLMRAATWSADFDLVDAIDKDILAELEEKNFSTVERKAVLRAISAAAGGGFSADNIDSLRKLEVDKLKSASSEVGSAFKLAVDFLKNEIEAPNADIIPYSNQIVVLADIYRRIKSPSAKQLKEIKKWFWRTTFSGYFSGWNTGQMASDLQAVKDFCSGKKDHIDISIIKPSSEIWKIRTFRSNNAHSKMLGLMLAHHGSLDLVTGQKLSLEKSLAWQNQKEYHHIFPQAFLKKGGITNRKINALANFALISSSSNKYISEKSPSEYMRTCIDEFGANFANIAEANLLTEAAINFILNDDYENFIEERANTLFAKAMNLCEWN